MQYCNVIIDINHEAIDRPFQYILPKEIENRVKIGSIVKVPFGSGNRLKNAYVIGFSNIPDIDPEKLKTINSIEDGEISVETELITLALWISKYYGATTASALKTVLPVSRKIKLPLLKEVSLIAENEKAKGYLFNLKKNKNYSLSKEKLIQELIRERALPWEVITKKLNISSNIIRDLEKREILSVTEIPKDYSPVNVLNIKENNIIYNYEQRECIKSFKDDWTSGIHGKYLLHGITGSGKTEVYMAMLETVLLSGKEAIVLIPEIALTYQTLMRFYHHFGNIVGVINSRLSQGERYEVLERAKQGLIKIIIGPRSALFTPFRNLGIIIIDEEHESSYKSEKMPRYHARECAEKRAEISGASLVLGSATPSVESYYRAKHGEIKLLKLTKRAGNAKPADCEIVDLREELRRGNRSIISKRLREEINISLENKKQVMLFLNRRGMLASLSCRSCGEVIKCPHCDISLSLHRDNRLYCHYCGYNVKMPDTCPSCDSKYIGGFRAGTQKIEEEIQSIFPGARVLRMDADSTKGKDGFEKILSRFSNFKADILVGTQMIVKGHDFERVSLVGILAADLSLNVNDFRCGERTFDLITQASGRAGRGNDAGKVIIQTYNPGHYAVLYGAKQDYEGFFEKEIGYRKLLQYPPLGHLLLIMLLSKDELLIEKTGNKLLRDMRNWDNRLWISNLVSPSVSKLMDVHRRMIYIKSENIQYLIDIRTKLNIDLINNKNITVYYDIDPVNI